jgi:tetratricopeptide (TPR) repeat protein
MDRLQVPPGSHVAVSIHKRLITLAIAVPLAVGAASFCGSPALAGKPTAQSKMQLGELLFFNGNIDGAINAFRYAIALDPKRWDAHLNLVNMYIQKNDFPAAIEECREVLKVKPDHKDVHLILGNLLRAQNDLDGAIAELMKALESGANPAVVHNAVGLVHLQKGDHDKADEHLQKAIAAQPKNFPDAHLTRAVVLFKKGKKEEAIAELDIAIKQKGKYPEAHNAKGDMLQADKKFDEAIIEYQKAIEEEPKYAQAWANIANIYFSQEKIDEARKAYQKAKDINPQDKNLCYGLGLMLEKLGKVSEAIPEFEAGLANDNDPQMKAQIQAHVDQLKGVAMPGLPGMGGGAGLFGAGAYSVGGGALGGGGMRDAAGNPFGVDFTKMVKVKSASKKEAAGGTK